MCQHRFTFSKKNFFSKDPKNPLVSFTHSLALSLSLSHTQTHARTHTHDHTPIPSPPTHTHSTKGGVYNDETFFFFWGGGRYFRCSVQTTAFGFHLVYTALSRSQGNVREFLCSLVNLICIVWVSDVCVRARVCVVRRFRYSDTAMWFIWLKKKSYICRRRRTGKKNEKSKPSGLDAFTKTSKNSLSHTL